MGDPKRTGGVVEDEFDRVFNRTVLGADNGPDAFDQAMATPPAAVGGTAGGSFEPDPNLAPPSEPSLLEQFLNLFPKATADNPLGIDPRAAAAQQAQWDRMSQPGGIMREGINSLVQPAADAMMMSEGGPIAGAIKDVGGAAFKRGADAYTQSGGDILEALVAAKDAATDPLGLALSGGGAALRGISSLLQGGSNRARQAAFGATKDDLRELGTDAAGFAQRTDELGLNNRVIPMDRADKRAAIERVLEDRGAKHDAAIAAADEADPLTGRDVGREIAQDIDFNADRVMGSGSNQREGIQRAMIKTAQAAEARDPIRSLADLADYRTQQGGQAFGKFSTLPETASGKGALAGYDSSNQILQQEMAASGDANYRLFTSADNDFHDAKLLEELTQQPQASNPWRRGIGAAVGAGVGMMIGGPVGAGVGAGVADMTRGYQADAAANLMKLGASGADAMGQVAQRVGAPAAAEQLQQVQSQSRGQMQPQIVESLLDSNPQALGPYAQPLMQARKDGTLNQKLTQLRNTDDVWQRQFLPQLQQMSAQAP